MAKIEKKVNVLVIKLFCTALVLLSRQISMTGYFLLYTSTVTDRIIAFTGTPVTYYC